MKMTYLKKAENALAKWPAVEKLVFPLPIAGIRAEGEMLVITFGMRGYAKKMKWRSENTTRRTAMNTAKSMGARTDGNADMPEMPKRKKAKRAKVGLGGPKKKGVFGRGGIASWK